MLTRARVATVTALLILGSASARAQQPKESLVAWSLDLRGRGRPGENPLSYGAGLSVRALSASRLAVRIGIAAARVPWSGTIVCVWEGSHGPCDTRQLESERSAGLTARWSLPNPRFYVHGGVSALQMAIRGKVYHSPSDPAADTPDTRTLTVGSAQLGLGVRTRNSASGPWLELGADQNAATRRVGAFLRAAFGVH